MKWGAFCCFLKFAVDKTGGIDRFNTSWFNRMRSIKSAAETQSSDSRVGQSAGSASILVEAAYVDFTSRLCTRRPVWSAPNIGLRCLSMSTGKNLIHRKNTVFVEQLTMFAYLASYSLGP